MSGRLLDLDRVPIVRDIRAKNVAKEEAQKQAQEEAFWRSDNGLLIQAHEGLLKAMTNPSVPYVVYDDD